MRRVFPFFIAIIIVTFWIFLSVPNGRAYQGTSTPTPVILANPPWVNKTHPVSVAVLNAPNQILVKFNPNLSVENKKRLLGSATINPHGGIQKLGVTLLDVPAGQLTKTLLTLRQNPDVIYAEPNYIAHVADTIPNDPDWNEQINLQAIRAPQGWDLNTGSSAVTIAIVDTGVDTTHPDLAGRTVPGYDFVENDNTPQDEFGHGTHVAGIAGAATDNLVGIAGVNWGAHIMPVRVLDASGNGTYEEVSNGIIWAADQGAAVINLSLGGDSGSQTLEDAINYAIAQHVIVVAASGNAGIESLLYPARYPVVIAVGAVDELNVQASFSNYGSDLDLVAPGVNILSAGPGNIYFYDTGTSMATPHVSGLAALLLGLPDMTPDMVEERMKSTTLDLGTPGWDKYYGSGLIQMDRAILNTTNSLKPQPRKLPDTGFAPGIRPVPAQPVKTSALTYTGYPDLQLDIPAIGVHRPIVGVPQQNDAWDLTWLGSDAGWLNGSAFPTWSGNSVITGHVWNADNTPGIFISLKNLRYDDFVRVRAFGQVYNYQVRSNELLSPDSPSRAFQHETQPWLTLLTCENFETKTRQYLQRRMVRAVLVSVTNTP